MESEGAPISPTSLQTRFYRTEQECNPEIELTPAMGPQPYARSENVILGLINRLFRITGRIAARDRVLKFQTGVDNPLPVIEWAEMMHVSAASLEAAAT